MKSEDMVVNITLVSHEMRTKFRTQHKGPDEICYLARSQLSGVIVRS